MGGIFGKNKRPCVCPRVVYRAKGRKAARTPRVFCDASTWTGENYFHSARIGRTPRCLEPSARVVLGTCEGEPKEDTAEPAAPRRARFSVAAGDARVVEVSQEHEEKPHTEELQHLELFEEAKPAQSGQSLQESSGFGDVLCPAGCREDHDMPPLTWTTVEVEVHVSADVQGEPGEVQAATAESELLAGAEQEAGAGEASEEAGVGEAHWAGDSPGAPGAVEESGLPLEAAEKREGTTLGQGSAEGAEAPPEDAETPSDLQLGQDTEVPVSECVKENAFEAEQAEELAEVCDHGQTSEAGTQAALQEKEKIQGSSEGEPEEH